MDCFTNKAACGLPIFVRNIGLNLAGATAVVWNVYGVFARNSNFGALPNKALTRARVSSGIGVLSNWAL